MKSEERKRKERKRNFEEDEETRGYEREGGREIDGKEMCGVTRKKSRE